MSPTGSRRSGIDAALALQAAIDQALVPVRARRRVSDENVHECRKAVKKARAVLRLVRCGIDDAAYRLENRTLRDAGRALSPLRNAKSLLVALACLRDRYEDQLSGVKLAPVEKSLRAGRTVARRHFTRAGGGLNRYMRTLKGCQRLAARHGSNTIAAETLARGVRRIYRIGRKALSHAEATASVGALHEWRKQVKYLENALAALYGPAERGIKRTLRRIHRLSDRLGEDHDLALLAQVRTGEAREPAVSTLKTLIVRRRAQLQKRAFALGHKLYAPTPKRFEATLPGLFRANDGPAHGDCSLHVG